MNWASRKECHCPLQSEREKIFDLGCIQKKGSIRCPISRSKTRYIVFQHKLLFNLVKDLFKWFEALWRSVTVRVQSEREGFFVLGCVWKSTRYNVKFCAQKLSTVFQHKLFFNLVKDLFKWIEVLGRSVIAPLQSETETIFDPGCIQKKGLDTLSNFALKNSIYSVST